MDTRPSDYANGDSHLYWQAAKEKRLEFQQCQTCGHIQFPPRVQCGQCWSNDIVPHPCSGKGVIESVTVVERAPLPRFRNKVPYAVVAVKTDEGPRMITNLVGQGALEADIGDTVQVCFEKDEEGNVLPQWTRVNR